ncbi:MAG: dihydropteroate synthase [Acidimicrobiia bacterium]|nr:dihydropteroate synthase [Acidimicrobiia bacterium]
MTRAPQWELKSNHGPTLRWAGTAVMGIVNVTPDSFSDGGHFSDPETAISHGLRLVAAGALIIDVGGESTRPGATAVPAEVEIQRVVPVIRALSGRPGVVVSVDTRKAAVAEAAIAAGARLVNDVGGLRDEAMVQVCAATGTPAVIMHMLGKDPASMQQRPVYRDVVAEVAAWLAERADHALAAGVPAVMVDPGIGFGKTLQHNLALLRAVDRFGPHPILIGASRKNFLGIITAEASPDQRDTASIAAHVLAARGGAAMVRVHDVAGHVAALRIQAALDWPEPPASL